jgi:hypothetical protein
VWKCSLAKWHDGKWSTIPFLLSRVQAVNLNMHLKNFYDLGNASLSRAMKLFILNLLVVLAYNCILFPWSKMLLNWLCAEVVWKLHLPSILPLHPLYLLVLDGFTSLQYSCF